MSGVDIEVTEEDARRPLPPPPRRVRREVWWSFLAHSQPAVAGCAMLGIISLVFVPQLLHMDLVGTCRLACFGRLARGRVVASQTQTLTDQGRPVIRYVFRFTGPSGTTVRGVCYSSTRRLTIGQTMMVEYDPWQPSKGRIVGTSTGLVPIRLGDLAFMSIFPTLACLLIAAAGYDASRSTRLLAEGFATRGRITAVIPYNNEGARRVVPFEEYEQWAGDRPVLVPYRWSGCVWLAAAVLATVAGLIACGILLSRQQTDPTIVRIFGRPLGRWPALLCVLASGAAIVVLGIRMIVQGGRWLSIPTVDSAGMHLLTAPCRRIRCTVRFEVPKSGEAVQSDHVDAVFLTVRPIEASQRILFDPDRPRSILLVDGQFPPVAFLEDEAWVSLWPSRPLRRLVAMGLGVAGGLAIGVVVNLMAWA
jgi:hypothetical protein